MRLQALGVLVLCGLRLAAQSCPPVNFQNVSRVYITGFNHTSSGLERMSDGSFTLHTYTANHSVASVQQLAPTPNYQANFLACSAHVPKAFVPPSNWSLFGDTLLGTLPRNPAGGNLLGNGTPVGLCLWPCGLSPSTLQIAVATPQGNLSSAPTYPVTPDAGNILLADVNNDGLVDVILPNFDTNSVWVYLMQANGTLGAPTMAVQGAQASSATVADLNGDDKVDLVVAGNNAGGQAGIFIALGNGNGTFQTATFVSLPGSPVSVVAADLNGDRKLDLAVAAIDSLEILFGNGDGTFQAPQVINTPGADVSTLAVADLNNDGKPDIVLIDAGDGVALVLLNAGGGTFPGITGYIVGLTEDISQLFLMDFDWDGNNDMVFGAGHPDSLIAAEYTSALTVLFGNGDGTFSGIPAYPLAGGRAAVIGGIAIADFNGDGKPDAVTGTNGGISLLTGQGNGTFTVQSVTSQGSTSLAAGDFTNNGKMDFIATNDNGVTVFLGGGNGTFQQGEQLSASSSGLIGAVVADFNGDGNLDFAVVDSLGGTSANALVYLGNGNGTFQSPRTVTVGSSPMSLQALDVNGDGKPDLVVTNLGTYFSTTDPGSVAVLLGNGDGTFKPAVQYPAGLNPQFTAVIDINGDGKPDLVTSTELNFNTYSFGLSVRLNQGNGAFSSAQTIVSAFSPEEIGAADFNGDGKIDLLVAHCCGDVQMGYFLGNGNGTFQPEKLLVAGEGQRYVAVADLNGDGKPDAMFQLTGPYTAAMTNITVPTTAITIQTSPEGLQFSVDGGTAQTAPKTLNLAQGSHTIAVATPQAGGAGTQYVFSSWSDGGAASHSITVGASPAAYIANFTTQYQLTISAAPTAGGTVTPASGGFYAAGTVVNIAAAPATGYTFAGWSGPVANASGSSTTVTMTAAETVTANFSPATGITIQTNPTGLQFTVDNGAAQTAPKTLTLSAGNHTIAVASPQAGAAGTQYVFASWSDGGAASHTITVGSSAATYMATFTTQYLLTSTVSPSGAGTVTANPAAASGYYNAGSSVQLTAAANTGYQFSSWAGGLSGTANPQSITMSAAASVTANFSAVVTSCSFTFSPLSASVPATGTSTAETCPNNSGQPNCGVAPEVPVTFTVTPGASCGAWTATSSNPEFLQITSGASGSGEGKVGFTVLNNTHNGAQNYTITLASGSSSAKYAVTEAGSGDSEVYRQIYALYEQLLGRDPDAGGFAFWTGVGGAGLGQMADSFLTSPEAFNSDFAVMAAYQAATGAAPTFAQYNAGVASIRAGGQSIPGLFSSLTGAGFTMSNLYENLLGRAPGASDSSCTSMSLANCFQAIIGYPSSVTPVGAANNEFQSTGSFHTVDHTNGLYVQMIYYVTLSRDPDPSGLAFWIGVANTGGPGVLFQGSAGYPTRIQILGPGTPNQGFIGSPEFQSLFAN